MKIELIITGVLMILGFCLIFYVLRLYSLAKSSVSWPTCKAVIETCKVSVVTSSDSTNNHWRMKLIYCYNVDLKEYRGKRYFFGSAIAGINPEEMVDVEGKFKRQEKVEISYSPLNPAVSTVKSGLHRNLQLAFLVLLLGNFFLVYMFIHFL